VNCIQSLFLADGDKFLLTPTYHVFAMYAAHQGGQSVRVVSSAPAIHWHSENDRELSLWGLNGSASVQGDVLTLTVTNPHVNDAREAEVTVRGAAPRSVTATTLTARDVHDHNTFASTETVTPTTQAVQVSGSPFVYSFPAASVTKLEMGLG
jgi:alpha-L-arabinofuranosidase